MFTGLEALKQSGKLHKAKIVGYKGGFKLLACCPFHHESNPSFAVFESGGYHCKGCGVSGLVSRTDGSGDDLLSHLSLERPAPHFLQRNPAPNSTSLEPELLWRVSRPSSSAVGQDHGEAPALWGPALWAHSAALPRLPNPYGSAIFLQDPRMSQLHQSPGGGPESFAG